MPRYQKITLWVLLSASIVMTIVLIHLREKAADRLLAGQDTSPVVAPQSTARETVSLLVANDLDGSLMPQAQQIPLPSDAGARARVLLEKLFEIYADPKSSHPITTQAGGVEEVFLLPLPQNSRSGGPEGMMAVVNLKGAFVDAHPSGIEAETLTILSICGTLHANLPQITEVRFLVDGEQRQTLAGHADLTRAYLASSIAVGSQP
jgi:hypothetical protein